MATYDIPATDGQHVIKASSDLPEHQLSVSFHTTLTGGNLAIYAKALGRTEFEPINGPARCRLLKTPSHSLVLLMSCGLICQGHLAASDVLSP